MKAEPRSTNDAKRHVDRTASVLSTLDAAEQRESGARMLKLVNALRQDDERMHVFDDRRQAAVGRLLLTTAVYLGMHHFGEGHVHTACERLNTLTSCANVVA